MMDTQNTSQLLAEYDNVAVSLPGRNLPWMAALRREALTHFTEQGFPSPREEEWKYTNVAAIEKKRFRPVVAPDAVDLDTSMLEKYQLSDHWRIVLINGRFSAEYSSLEGLPADVKIMNMAEALVTCPEQVKLKMGQAIRSENHGFIHFNTAWFTDGLFLYVPEKTVLSRPIQLLHVMTRNELLATTRNIIVLEAMAEAEITETYIGMEGLSYLTAGLTEVFIGANAALSLIKMQSEANKAFHFGGTYVQQDRNARFTHHNFCFGGLLARNEVHCNLDQAAECYLNGLYTGVKQQHMDNHTRINHLQPHGLSRELYKGILDQRARGVFQGRIVVFEDAQKTDSEMNNRNLLLSENAEADTKPQLEIYADDVKCAHGVTVGQLEDKSIFYLQSRGMDQETARNMLTFAFANEMVEKIGQEEVRSMARDELLKHFPQTGIVREWL